MILLLYDGIQFGSDMAMIPRFGDGRDWFFEKKFGLFVHWGLYAGPAWHEQLQWRGCVARAEYEKLIDQFNPTRFDPDAWLDLAEEAGMEQVCFTTKHHDGFCMWDTKQTDFNVMNSPYGKDIVKALADACARRGFVLSLYYSCVDWHHPNYPNQNRSHELPGPDPGDDPDVDRYMAFLKEQTRELCTGYGDIGGIWWDGGSIMEVKDPSVNEMVRSLQPKAVLNNRGFDDGDFATPERQKDWVDEVLAFEGPTEACQAAGRESWGYREGEDYYTVRHLIRSIDKVMARGGRYLLNVGPKADGTIADQDASILRAIGKWYHGVEESFDAEPASDMIDNREVLLTRNGNTLYVHLYKDPTTSAVKLRPITAQPRKATLLNTGEDVRAKVEFVPTYFTQKPEWGPDRMPAYLRLSGLPVEEIVSEAMVVKLEFDELP